MKPLTDVQRKFVNDVQAIMFNLLLEAGPRFRNPIMRYVNGQGGDMMTIVAWIQDRATEIGNDTVTRSRIGDLMEAINIILRRHGFDPSGLGTDHVKIRKELQPAIF